MWIDLAFVIFAMYGMYLGFKKGIMRTLVALASIVIGVIIALKVSPYVIAYAQEIFKIEGIIVVIIGFLLTYYIIILLIKLLGKSLEKGLRKVKLNFINKAIGGMILTLFFVFVYSIIVWFLDEADIITNSEKDRSITYPIVKVLPDHGKNLASGIKPFFESFWEMVDNAADDIDED